LGKKTLKDEINVNLDKPENYFEIFPNPSNSIITLRSNSSNGVVNIFNELGVIVYTTYIQGEDLMIDLSEFSKSIYYIELKDENKEISIKRKLVLY
jgi:hypothetical protein